MISEKMAGDIVFKNKIAELRKRLEYTI
jgi:hypothetical protein